MQVYEYLANVVNAQLKGEKPCNLPDNISFEEIFGIASRNHLSYMFFSALLHEEQLNDNQKQQMRMQIKNSVMTTLIQLTELKSLLNEFETSGIKCMPMKGSILKYVYPRPELREMSDIDILIAPNDTEKAGEVLLNLGYSAPSSVKHHDVYSKGPFMVVEAHKALYDKTVDNNQYEYFVGFDKAVLREGCNCTYDFKHEDFYVYMIAHAAKHFYAMGCGIRNLIDIYVYLSKYRDSMDMEYTRNELEKCGIADFAFHMEKLAFDWLDGKKLDSFYDSLFQYMQDSGIYGKDENGIWNKFCDEEKANITKFELKMWYFFPPLYYMSDYYPWLEDNPFLLPWAWFIRLFKGFFLHKGTQKRKMVKSIKTDEILRYKSIYQKMNLKFSRT